MAHLRPGCPPRMGPLVGAKWTRAKSGNLSASLLPVRSRAGAERTPEVWAERKNSQFVRKVLDVQDHPVPAGAGLRRVFSAHPGRPRKGGVVERHPRPLPGGIGTTLACPSWLGLASTGRGDVTTVRSDAALDIDVLPPHMLKFGAAASQRRRAGRSPSRGFLLSAVSAGLSMCSISADGLRTPRFLDGISWHRLSTNWRVVASDDQPTAPMYRFLRLLNRSASTR
jgi:hypothetical protein